MCTVSFHPTGKGWFLTSSRDVKLSRPKAVFPKEKKINNIQILYPEDGLALGTWIGSNSLGTTICLLNGAFDKHVSEGSYGKSRGQIVLDILSHKTPTEYLNSLVLDTIEPFTLLLISNDILTENRWDGEFLHKKILNNQEKHIWSSCTLYSNEIIQKRITLFEEWPFPNKNILSEKDLIDFHSNAFQELGKENQTLMSRPNSNYGTVSITCLEWNSKQVSFCYKDVINNSSQKASLFLDLHFAESSDKED